MNNKGQSLVLFCLVIPIIVGVIVLVVDAGNALIKKNSLDNITEVVLDYGLDRVDDHYKYSELEIRDMMKYNSGIDSEVKIIDNVIAIRTEVRVEGIFSSLFNISGFRVISEYKGYVINNKKKIIKEI